MELTIGWGVIAKVMVAGIGTYVLLPAILVVRDWLLWKAIERFILTSRLRTLISMRANDIWHLNNKYNYERKLEVGPGGARYFLNGIEVDEKQYSDVNSAIELHSTRANSAGAEITWKSNLIDWLLRHYKQEGDANPITVWEEEASQSAARINSKAVS